jgi:hypothetical protein
MSPLFLVNWHRLNGHFRTLMWMVAIALAVVILLGTTHNSYPTHPNTAHTVSPHVVAGTVRADQ